MSKPVIADVRGIGPSTAEALARVGVTTVAQLAAMPVDALAAVPGFGPARATAVRASAEHLAVSSGQWTPAGEDAPPGRPATGAGAAKRAKDRKKGKQKDGKGKRGKRKKGKKEKSKTEKGKGKGKRADKRGKRRKGKKRKKG